MGLVVHGRLAIPLLAIAFFTVAVAVPAAAAPLLIPPTTALVVAALGITAIVFLMSSAIPFLRASHSLVPVRGSGQWEQASSRITMTGGICTRTLEQPNWSTTDDTVDLVRRDDDGGWQMPA
jgi:hypothetical protein